MKITTVELCGGVDVSFLAVVPLEILHKREHDLLTLRSDLEREIESLMDKVTRVKDAKASTSLRLELDQLNKDLRLVDSINGILAWVEQFLVLGIDQNAVDSLERRRYHSR